MGIIKSLRSRLREPDKTGVYSIHNGKPGRDGRHAPKVPFSVLPINLRPMAQRVDEFYGNPMNSIGRARSLAKDRSTQ
jgi:hypothetical protein